MLKAETNYRQFDDIHIDELDSAFQSRKTWAVGGIECLNIAASIRDELDIPLCLALAFSLQGNATPRRLNFASIEELIKECDDTPPSLYLLDYQDAMWVDTPKSKVPWSLVKIGPTGADCYYIEYIETDDPDHRGSF